VHCPGMPLFFGKSLVYSSAPLIKGWTVKSGNTTVAAVA
jgi:hypothetical protein